MSGQTKRGLPAQRKAIGQHTEARHLLRHGGPWTHCAEWKQPVPGDRALSDSIYTERPEWTRVFRQKAEQGLPTGCK